MCRETAEEEGPVKRKVSVEKRNRLRSGPVEDDRLVEDGPG